MAAPIQHLTRYSRLLLPLVLASCTVSVGAVAPRPTINLSPTISDVVDAWSDSYNWKLHVTGFRSSLHDGYVESFRPYYELVGDRADLTLRFESLSIEIASTEIASRGRMIVHFAAQLDDRDGKTLRRSFGSLTSTPRYILDADRMLKDGLAMVFEKVATDCFVPLSIAH